MIKHINEIILPEVDKFTRDFNYCSEQYLKSIDKTLSKEERDEASERWFNARQCLELGIN